MRKRDRKIKAINNLAKPKTPPPNHVENNQNNPPQNPIGCLSGCLGIVILFPLFILTIGLGICDAKTGDGFFTILGKGLSFLFQIF